MKSPQDIRIVFMGTPEFASASLLKLIEKKCQVVAVVTSPDKPAGRGRSLRSSHVKETALHNQLKVLQPEKLKDPDFLNELHSLHPDLMIVVAFRMLPAEVWKIPHLGTFNLHASLLPQYRGAAPINHVLINGEKESGLTTFLLDHEIDTGKILLQRKVSLNDKMSAGELHDQLMVLGANLVYETVEKLVAGDIQPKPQPKEFNETLHDAPKIHKADCRINWTAKSHTIYNLVRGLSPYPTAWTVWTDHEGSAFTVKIFELEIDSKNTLEPGQIRIQENGVILIGSGSHNLKVISFQPQGKKRLTAEEFLRGFRKKLVKAE